MKKYIFKIVFIAALLFSFSCEDYLDKAPESILDQEDVFKDFDHAQGFVEQMYALVADVQQGGHNQTDYLHGDDAIINNTWQTSAQIDKGNLTFVYQRSGQKFSYYNNHDTHRPNDPNNSAAFNRPGVWNGSLMGIRIANLLIENIDLMVNATQEEKDVVLGQSYFFRAFFHLEIQKWWGSYPYIDRVLSDDYKLTRPTTWKESALKAHEDFQRAADLLPVDWDDMSYGAKTLGENKGRVTKGAAYAYMGKNMLLAASPLMKGSADTYDYDTEMAEKAVDAFAQVLKIADQGRYELASFEKYEEVFWKVPKAVWPGTLSGSEEFIFNGSSFKFSDSDNITELQMDNKVSGGNSKILSPTHNFIHHNFGMANGLSIEDDLSGEYGTPTYDPLKPFENRDPRFYKWITVDGDVLATKSKAGNHKIAQTYTGGLHRGGGTKSGTATGYFFKKFYPTLHSKWNNIDGKYTIWRIRMRLTDVYLMYAEALHAAKNSATTAPSSYNLTAEDVVNMMRDRAGVPHVNSAIVGDPQKFMDELRRERSVELSFEAHRWLDIKRWVLAHLPKYKNKTGLEFDKNHSYFKEYTIIPRVCDYPKHFWFPFEPNQTQFYEGFHQNPGW